MLKIGQITPNYLVGLNTKNNAKIVKIDQIFLKWFVIKITPNVDQITLLKIDQIAQNYLVGQNTQHSQNTQNIKLTQ